MTFREWIIVDLSKMYLRTFPPINKNGNGIISNVKRFLLSILINIITGWNEQLLKDTMKKFEKLYLKTE